MNDVVDHEARRAAYEAKKDLHSHEDICALRYDGIIRAVETQSEKLDKHAVKTEQHFKTLYNRWWVIVAGLITSMTGLIAYLLVKVLGL